jgi:hypothetical protein
MKIFSFKMEIEDDKSSSKVIVLYEQVSESWINAHNVMLFMEKSPFKGSKTNSIQFITASNETGFLHLYYYEISLNGNDLKMYNNNSCIKQCSDVKKVQLTTGDWCVSEDRPINFDKINNTVYFTSYRNPVETHLFCVNLFKPLEIVQLTKDGFSHSVTMNSDCSLFVSVESNLRTPSVAFIYRIVKGTGGGVTVQQLAKIKNTNSDIPKLPQQPQIEETKLIKSGKLLSFN